MFLLVPACVALHNFLRTEDLDGQTSIKYCPTGYADVGDQLNGEWRTNGEINALQEINKLSSNMHSRAAAEMRDDFANYFMNEGSVIWQRRSVGLE